MNIRDLNYFLTIGRLLHFGKAAEACHVSQPALSNQIKKLENELGVILFERNNKHVRLTEAGQALIPLAEEAVTVFERIKITANAATQPFSGTLRLGAIPTIAPYLIPKLYRLCQQRLPELSVEFDEEITDQLTAKLVDGSIDAALIATPIESNKLDIIELYDEPFWVVFPKEHQLEKQRIIKSEHLPQDELLLLNEGHCFRDQAADICHIDDQYLRRSIRANSLEMLLKMVAVGQGITLVPESAIDHSRFNELSVKSEKINDAKAYRRVCLAYRKTFPRPALLNKIAELTCMELPSELSVRFNPHAQ